MSLFSKKSRTTQDTNKLRTLCLLKQQSPGSTRPGASSRCIAPSLDKVCSELHVETAHWWAQRGHQTERKCAWVSCWWLHDKSPGEVGRTTRNLGKPGDNSQVAGKVLQGLILKTNTMILGFIFLCAFFFNQEHTFHVTLHFEITLKGIENRWEFIS